MSTTTHTDAPGPRLLNERSLLGIFVHGIAMVTGVVGAGLVYLLARHEFTRENARNALNWRIVLDTSLALAVGLLFLVDGVQFPGPVETVLTVLLFGLVLVSMILAALNFVFVFVATGKAIFGTAWDYPLVPEII